MIQEENRRSIHVELTETAYPSKPDERFRSHHRLKLPEEFREVFRKGRRVLGGGFALLGLKGPAEASPQLGFSLSKKQLRRSVDRKRVKRLVVEFFRKHKAAWPGCRFVFLGSKYSKASIKGDNAALFQTIASLWDQWNARHYLSELEAEG